MKSIVLSLVFAWIMCASVLHGQAVQQAYAKGKLFLKVHDGIDLELQAFRKGEVVPSFAGADGFQEVLKAFGATELFKPFKTKAPVLQKTYELRFDGDKDAWAFAEALMRLPFVEYAEPVAIYQMHYAPNDQNAFQWHLNKISAPAAWDICRGSRTVVVAVVDDAVRMDHADLASQIWTNADEVPGDSIDNDGNGWIDDVHGYDLAEDDNDPAPPSGATNNNFSHGTHVAGIAAAATDNGLGIASIGFNVSIMPCKVKLDSTISDPELQYTYYGVDYAIANKANVVNMSFGGTGYNATFANLLSVGRDSGVVFVASAGNTGSYSIQYPAGYPDAISVASTGSSDALSGFSTYHPSVDVSAPGSNIYSSTAGSTTSYGFMSGTSMSAPVVSGLVALMASLDSTATPATLRSCLESSTDNIDAQNANKLGYFGTGRVNAQKALQCLVPVSNEFPSKVHFSVQRVHPNPNNGIFKANYHLPRSGEVRIRVVDLAGRVVWEKATDALESGEHSDPIETMLDSGLYLMVMEFEGEIVAQRFMVAR